MYETFYGLSEKPFSIIPDPSFLYLSRQHSMALDLVEYGLINQAGFDVITGAIGTGKTTLIRFILSQIDQDISVGLISNTHRDFGELLQWILFAFGQDYHGKTSVEMFEIFVEFLTAEYAKGRGTLLIIDEAQNMSVDSLEQLRMLSNINADKDQLLQIILVGQASLRETLKRPELEQFAQRIAVHYHLGPLDAHETSCYIQHRLKCAGAKDENLFDEAARRAVYHYSDGVPRVINLLCDTALVYGYAEGKPQIDAAIVEAVAQDKLTGGLFRVPGGGAVASRSAPSVIGTQRRDR